MIKKFLKLEISAECRLGVVTLACSPHRVPWGSRLIRGATTDTRAAFALTMPPSRPKPKRDFGFNAQMRRAYSGDRACLLMTVKRFVPLRGSK